MAEIQVAIQTLKNDRYDLKVNTSDTVEVLKQKISSLPLDPAIPDTSMRVIFNGNVMSDDSVTMEAAGVAANSLLVVMAIRKKKPRKSKKEKKKQSAKQSTPAPAPTPAPTPAPDSTSTPAPDSTSTSTPMETSDAPAAEPSTEASTEAPSTTEPAPGNASESAANAMVSGDAMEDSIAMLMSLGDYSVEQVRAALRAAFNNPNMAAQYLLEGIPAQLQQGGMGGGAMGGGAMGGMGGGMTQPAPEQPQMGGGGMGGMNMGGDDDQEGAGFMQMLQQNPQLMQMMMAMQQNPQLAQQVQQDPRLMMQMIQALQQQGGGGGMPMGGGGGMGGGAMGGGGGHGGPPPGAQRVQITLSEDERAMIVNLQSLAPGITQQMALEAFLACDRNQELAANYLLNQMFQ